MLCLTLEPPIRGLEALVKQNWGWGFGIVIMMVIYYISYDAFMWIVQCIAMYLCFNEEALDGEERERRRRRRVMMWGLDTEDDVEDGPDERIGE